MNILILLTLLLSSPAADAPAPERPCVLVVVGAEGTTEYGAEFHRWADLWQAAAGKAGAESIRIGDDPAGGPSDRDRLREALAAKAAAGSEPLWIVLIGHGTFDGRETKFNLRGPDVTDVELAEWLKPAHRPIAILDCTSASAPFLGRISGPDRIVVTATRSGDEQNFARFGGYLAESIGDLKADLDKDGQVSLLEAFLSASRAAEEFYKTKSRLATEHALIDDNGDKRGTPSDWFQGIRAVKKAKDDSEPDGLRSHQLCLIPSDRERNLSPESKKRRDQLERDAATLRSRKESLGEDDYYAKLEAIMSELAKIYRDGKLIE